MGASLASAVSAVVLAVWALPANAAFQSPAVGSRFAVATESADATRVGLEVLQTGGNAFDAAIACALALGVVAPTSSGLGGGGFAMIYVAKDHKTFALDFRESAPAHANIDDLIARSKSGSSIGVPGEPAGLEWLSTHYAKRSLGDDAYPAAMLASRGYVVGQHLAEMAQRDRDGLARSPLAGLYAPSGSPVTLGTTVQNADLGRTIARFGAEGSKPFYQGDIALKIVAASTAVGGTIDQADLAGYAVKERAPLVRSFGTRTVVSMPAPSAGGLMQLELLSLFGADGSSPLHSVGFGSSNYFHMIAEGMRGAIADRARLAGDPDLDPQVNTAFTEALDPAQIGARRARIEPTKTHLAQDYKTHEDGTTHLVVTDDEGNVVSLTTTVNGPFGAHIVAGDTGILLNNELYDFSLPAEVTGFGVVGLGPNRPRAGARPVSSMAPVIVFEDGAPILALGGSGGRRIATETTQALFARLVFGLDASACVSAPRIYTSGADVFLDPEISEDVRVGLAARGETVRDEPFLGTAVQLIAWDRNNGAVRLQAASDPRKQGFAAAQ